MSNSGRRIKRELLFLNDKDYKRLSPEESTLLKKFRSTLRYRNDHDKSIKKLRQQVKDKRKKIDQYDLELSRMYHLLTPLVEMYYFSVSITSFKKGPNRTEYFNLCINRPGLNPKSISLGTKNTIKQHLRESFPNDIDKINKNWRGFLKVNSNKGRTYDLIHDEIMKYPLDFNKNSYNKLTFLPVK